MENKKIEVQCVKINVTNVSSMIIALLCKNIGNGTRLSNAEIASEVVKVFTTRKTSSACVAWYASKLKNPGFSKKHGIEKYQELQSRGNVMKTVEINIPIA